jgi:uncharacterized membrane protein YphA (DoxX/SURF4 family)
MNILLWVLQILLALYYAMGGRYQLNTKKLPGAWLKAWPKPVWICLGVLQILFAVGLVVPKLAPIAAICVVVQTLLVGVRFTKFPGLLWLMVPALLALFVAYGRIVLQPF